MSRSRGVSRRDVLNGVAIASGAAIGRSFPFSAHAGQNNGLCDGDIGRDPRVLRGGNLPSTFEIAHWLRDRRLSVSAGEATLSAGCDAFEGAFPIKDDAERFDVVVIGGGLAGLASAFFLLRRRSRLKILLLEAGPALGGNAGRDDAPPFPVPASTAGAYAGKPGTEPLREFYREIGVDWSARAIADPVSNYYFDDHTPGATPGYRGWNIDTFEAGLARTPYHEHVVGDLLRSREAILALDDHGAGLSDPADQSAAKYDDLSTMSLQHYLEEVLRCDPAVTDFYTTYTLTALGGAAHQVDAHSALTFLIGEFTREGLFTFPGGTSELARLAQRWLAASETRGAQPPRIELNATALRIEPKLAPQAGAEVVYFQDHEFRRVAATKIILAAPPQIARHLVEHFSDEPRKAAFGAFHAAPLVTANVALRSAAPLLELGLGYSQTWWGGRFFANYVVADWAGTRRSVAHRPTVLTFYGGSEAALDELGNERLKLMRRPFSEYEDSLRSDLARLMRGTTFDFDRDVSALFLYRWGHSMLRPPPNWLFGDVRGADGRLDRAKAPRRIACAPLGPVLFAGQHTEGTPSVESAIASGYRAAHETLADL